MRRNLNKSFTKLNNSEEDTALQFISSGLAAHALCLLSKSGILKKILEEGFFTKKSLHKFQNPALLLSALSTLVGSKVMILKDSKYVLSNLGKAVVKKIGLLTLPLIGYGKLFSKQMQILENPQNYNEDDIDYAEVALSSIDFGIHDLDPILLNLFKNIKPRGTICDLGCGTGEKLAKICNETNCAGLGIEKNKSVIAESKKYTNCQQKLEIIEGDVTELSGIWEDVDIALMSFLYHDISPSNAASKTLKSFLNHFPRMQYLIIVDIVSLSEEQQTIMPGFDYVHGLQGITPRSYRETIDSFEKANYETIQEISVPNMPNTYIWVLRPLKQ